MHLLHFNDLLPYGACAGEEIRITKSFTLHFAAPMCESMLLLQASARCEGAPARVDLRLMLEGREKPLYHSHTYFLGNKAHPARRLGFPPVLWEGISAELHVQIPDGTVLYVSEFDLSHAEKLPKTQPVHRFNAHLGFLGMAPENTEIAFRLAALCGFSHCICVPKLTRDGVLVCTHDETINHAARHTDGRELERYIYVKDLTYQELLSYDFGIRKGYVFAGTRIARLEDFFALCAETGMDPMFSTHPALPHEAWVRVREMLTRHGLLSRFHVKSFTPTILKSAHDVFGEEIDGYTLDVQKLEADTIPSLLATGIDPRRSRVGIEVRLRHFRPEDAARIRAAGMFAAVWNLPRCDFDTVYGELIAAGVTEFTEDHHLPI